MRNDRYPRTDGFDATALLPVLVIIVAAFLFAACSPRVVTKKRVETVSVPVIQKCASEKPALVTPLRDRIDDAAWMALSLKQKAETAAAQGLRHMNYSDQLGAATSAC